MIKILSISKSLFLALLYLLFSPLLLILPKYKAYIFVLTTGRSGSGSMANLFKNSKNVNSFHEPRPILNNSFQLENNSLIVWNKFQFYFLKFPKILWSRLAGKKIYLETNHLFLKSFSTYAIKIFEKKMKIIHLKRPVELVAKSMYEIGKWPGTQIGNKWYLDPYSHNNRIKFTAVFDRIHDDTKDQYLELYHCIWYWFEMEKRIKFFKKNNSELDIVEIETNQLNNLENLIVILNNSLRINIREFSNNTKVNKNLKKDEKSSPVELEIVSNKVKLFRNSLYLIYHY